MLQGGGRFPSLASINAILEAAQNHNQPVNLALHVWGRDINDLLDDAEAHVCVIAKNFQRIQLSLLARQIPLTEIKALQDRFPDKTINVRYREPIRSGITTESIFVTAEKIEQDMGAEVTAPPVHLHVSLPAAPRLISPVHGCVSDLSQDNLAEYMREIQITMGDSDFCICMESSLRNEQGAFEVALALKALAAVEQALLIDDEMRSVSRAPANEYTFARPVPPKNMQFG